MAIIVSALTNWPCMMVVQWHLQLLENIVVPHHLTSSQRAMRYWYNLLHILGASQILDSNWCTIQQVINTVQIGLKFLATQSFLGLPFTMYIGSLPCVTFGNGKNHISKSCIRQKYLAYVIFGKFISLVGLGYFVSAIFGQSQYYEINIQKIELEKHT